MFKDRTLQFSEIVGRRTEETQSECSGGDQEERGSGVSSVRGLG